MTNVATHTPVGSSTDGRIWAALRRDLVLTTVGLIVALQAVWDWWAISRGWFLDADLSNLADGMGRRLNWSYLSNPLGGHFDPVDRLAYWLFDQFGPLDYSQTVATRVVIQALATVALYRLMCELVGRRWLVVAVLAVYAANPVMLGGEAWLTSGIGLTLAQLFAIWSLRYWVRWVRTGLARHALASGCLLAVAVLATDQWMLLVPVPFVLFLVHFSSGDLLTRLAALVRGYKAWLLFLAPVAVVAAGALSLGDATGAATLSLSNGVHLLTDTWYRSLAPSFIGGPIRWYSPTGLYLSFTAPPVWLTLLAELAFVVLVVAGVQRRGPRSLAAWIMPFVAGALGILFVGVGRYTAYGGLLALTPRYSYDLVPLFCIAAVLALGDPRAPTPDAKDAADPRESAAPGDATPDGSATQERADETSSVTTAPTLDLAQRLVATAVCLLVVGASLISGARFATNLGRSPVRSYVQTLSTSVSARGANVNLYDTAVPNSVVPGYEPSHRVSDVLRLAQVPAEFDDPSSPPLLAAADGTLTKATFLTASTGRAAAATGCPNFIHGAGTWVIPFVSSVHTAEWFVRLDLYQAQPATVSITAVDADGKSVSPLSGARVRLGRLESRVLALPVSTPIALRVTSTQPGTNLCLAQVSVGGPFPVAQGS